MKQSCKYILYTVMTLMMSSLAACKDDFPMPENGAPAEVAEGIPGELSLSVAADAFSKHSVSTRESHQATEQHLHSAYLFMLEYKEGGPENCKILTRKYYSEFPDIVGQVEEDGKMYFVRNLKMPALSSNKAFIFGVMNVGHSEVQGVANDAELLKECNMAKNLKDLHNLCARLEVTDSEDDKGKKEVNVERMQGHHLMSGYYTSLANRHFDKAEQTFLKLEAQADGSIKTYDAATGKLLKPMGAKTEGEASALFAHRLDARVTVNIIPDGDLKTTPGAYFKLTSWKVMNAPYTQHVYWQGEKDNLQREYANSILFKRNLNQTEGGGWTFSFYQFENYFIKAESVKNGFRPVGADEIAKQYNTEYHLENGKAVTAQMVEQAFTGEGKPVYPNRFSDFAYTMRELENKTFSKENENEKIEIPYKPGDEYVPNKPGNKDEVIIVDNAGFKYAPANSTYIRVTGEYYNPQEPVRRRKDKDKFPDMSFEEYPYLSLEQRPVKTVKEAAKRMRIATVVYRIHLGYVGGGNAALTNENNARQIQDFKGFESKLNDYNVLRNHHYIYNVKIAGVNNIKLEATRENGGNILEQENQTGAEGLVTESQHFYELDAHYETRNVTIDFRRIPDNYEEGFSFGLVTPFDKFRGTLKKAANGQMEIFDDKGKPLQTIRGRDLDWIHFAWHGDDSNPSRSLIDPVTGNGIPYSETYGGYEEQQTYVTNTKLTQEQNSDHPYRLFNALEFSQLVWTYFNKWKQSGKPADKQSMTFTIYIDEYYYDRNPVTGATVKWTDFCNKNRRKATFFMEKEETSADQQSWYADAHLVIYQNSIQTLYATETSRGQQVADVAFGIEGLDEFRAKYRCNGQEFPKEKQRDAGHGFVGISRTNGLYNTMVWFNGGDNLCKRIPWKEAEGYFNAKAMEKPLTVDDYYWTSTTSERDNRRGQWAVYSRNRDLNRNGVLDPDEVRWFVPAIDQYVLCFLGGRPVFRNPLFERDKAITVTDSRGGKIKEWAVGIPAAHFMSNTDRYRERVFWAEEGSTKGDYSRSRLHGTYGIRMARMLTKPGVVNSGAAFNLNNLNNSEQEKILAQDEIFIVSTSRNGQPVPYEERTDGRNYYIKLHKMNVDAFRPFIRIGEIGRHHHEEKQNWLYKEFLVAGHKIGYTKAAHNYKDENRIWKIDGDPNTWWRVNGVVTDATVKEGITGQYYYMGEENSLAFDYYERPDSKDKHHWRMPNLREASIMSMVFPVSWFGGQESSITSGTKSTNLGPQSTKIPFWNIRANSIVRMSDNEVVKFYVRGVYDVQ